MDPITNTNQLWQNALAEQAKSVANTPQLVEAIQQASNPDKTGVGSFSQILGNAINQTIDGQYNAERISRKALTGDANLTELVPALLNAETSLNTIVTIRDRVVEAYREILRTPI